MVAVLSSKLSALEARVDYIEDDFPETDVPDVRGDGGVSEYASYFRVIDASEWSAATPPALKSPPNLKPRTGALVSLS